MTFPDKRRTLLKSAALFVASLFLAAGIAPESLAHEKPRKALFVYGGWKGHAPEKYRDMIVPWLKSEGFEVTVSDTLEPYADHKLMGEVDLIVQIWTQGTITREQLKGLLAAVAGGVGLAGWHGGLADSFHDSQRYEYMIGGQWVEHPGNDGVRFRVNITDHQDPVTQGLADFDVVSEQYYMHVDPNNKVLATTTFNADHDYWVKGATMPVAWKKVYGKGRVFYTALGHQPAVFESPEALTMLHRGILWAARSKYEETPDLVRPMYPSALPDK
jgi:type 1 glutamine amidotransferase